MTGSVLEVEFVPLFGRGSRENFYRRKRAYEKDGEAALINSKPCPQNPKRRTPPHIEEKILHLRRTYHPGQRRLHWYLLQYTAIDDATRISALKVYARHTQENAIDFVNYVVEKFPFRISTIRTDNGHEFQSLFHWHVEDLGMSHTYIRVRTLRLNGKVEWSHRTDKEEFYQLLL